jgi:hypothetical protein
MTDAPEPQVPFVLRRMLATGIVSLLGGFALWFAFLGCDAAVFTLRVSKHTRIQGVFASDWCVTVGYGVAFFIAAFLVARCRWSCRPAIAAPVAYAVFLAVYLPSLNWSRRDPLEAVLLAIPLITSAIGGFIGTLGKERRP